MSYRSLMVDTDQFSDPVLDNHSISIVIEHFYRYRNTGKKITKCHSPLFNCKPSNKHKEQNHIIIEIMHALQLSNYLV